MEQQNLRLLRPGKIKHKIKQKIYVHKDWMRCSHVFVRISRVKKDFEPAYDGPFLVKLKHNDTKISVDRLKSAYVCQRRQPTNSEALF